MTQLAGYENVFLATFLLLLLALLTIEACRRDHISSSADFSVYLFRGRLPVHSLASNIGASFSLTYFFGAIVIYAQLFQSWAIVTLAAAFPVVCFLYQRLLKRAAAEIPAEEMVEQRGNILLTLLQKTLTEASFRTVSALFLVVYFGLLVEELAVSRVVLSSLIPNRPVVVALLLSLICLVVVVYLYLGGFRAVLISDFVQGAVLCSFFLMLVFLIVRHGSAEQLVNFPVDRPLMRASNLGFVGFLALAWFLAGVDYSARFNFDSKNIQDLNRKRRKLIVLSALLSLLALSLGILFSQALSKEIPATTAPTEYVSALAVFFLVKSAPAFRIVFLVSVHCMIFTTLDTLLVTALQISYYRRATLIDRLLFRRDRLLYLLLAASVVSCLIEKDHVHIVGIFIASLLCLLVFPCAKALFPEATRWFPEESSYLWWSLGIASTIFALLERRIVDAFDYHFLIPGLVLASLALTLGAQKLWGSWKRGKSVC
jgi:Na+/proline symporter